MKAWCSARKTTRFSSVLWCKDLLLQFLFSSSISFEGYVKSGHERMKRRWADSCLLASLLPYRAFLFFTTRNEISIYYRREEKSNLEKRIKEENKRAQEETYIDVIINGKVYLSLLILKFSRQDKRWKAGWNTKNNGHTRVYSPEKKTIKMIEICIEFPKVPFFFQSSPSSLFFVRVVSWYVSIVRGVWPPAFASVVVFSFPRYNHNLFFSFSRTSI